MKASIFGVATKSVRETPLSTTILGQLMKPYEPTVNYLAREIRKQEKACAIRSDHAYSLLFTNIQKAAQMVGLSPKQLCARLGISISTLRRLHQRPEGGPPFIPIGRRIFYPEDAVDEWLQKLKR